MKARRGHVVPARRLLRRVPTGGRPAVGVVDHKTRKAKFSVYQHYTLLEQLVERDMAITMSASELLYVNQTGSADAAAWRARQPAFYNVAAKWMSFNVTGMKMEIADETPMQQLVGGTQGFAGATVLGAVSLFYDHRGGAWSTTWNETEGDSHKPMVQYVENVHPPNNVAPRWSFQKEAKWEDKSYRRALFGARTGQSNRWGGRKASRLFFKRYCGMRSAVTAGVGANGIHVEPTRRDVLPVLHLHQPDQFLQYQVSNIRFGNDTQAIRFIRFRVKKTIYVEFVDKREMRDISRTPMGFRPHNDECYDIVERPTVDLVCGGCTGIGPGAECQIAGAPAVGPIQDPAACSSICGASCESMVCGPGTIASEWNPEGCVTACAAGTFQPGAPCFEVAAACPEDASLLRGCCTDACPPMLGGTCAALGSVPGNECIVGEHLEAVDSVSGSNACTDGGAETIIAAHCVPD